jgi:hypothetical protein
MWETTPFHRVEAEGDASDLPPEVAEGVVDERVQRAASGRGRMVHRQFRVRIAGARLDAAALMTLVVTDFKHFVPAEVVDVRTHALGDSGLRVGDEMVVEMPGPWNGPVRVVHRNPTCLRLVTLRGHLEAGQVQFHARQDGDLLVFEIDLWARAATMLVEFLYARLRLAKEVQLNMWVRFCLAAMETSGGRLVDGVHICTRWLPEQEHRHEDTGALEEKA